MLFMVGFVFRRTGTTDLDELGGLFDRIPFLAVAFLIGGLAIVGMPGTPGFDAAHLMLEAVDRHLRRAVDRRRRARQRRRRRLPALGLPARLPRAAAKTGPPRESTAPCRMEYLVGGMRAGWCC